MPIDDDVLEILRPLHLHRGLGRASHTQNLRLDGAERVDGEGFCIWDEHGCEGWVLKEQGFLARGGLCISQCFSVRVADVHKNAVCWLDHLFQALHFAWFRDAAFNERYIGLRVEL